MLSIDSCASQSMAFSPAAVSWPRQVEARELLEAIANGSPNPRVAEAASALSQAILRVASDSSTRAGNPLEPRALCTNGVGRFMLSKRKQAWKAATGSRGVLHRVDKHSCWSPIDGPNRIGVENSRSRSTGSFFFSINCTGTSTVAGSTSPGCQASKVSVTFTMPVAAFSGA